MNQSIKNWQKIHPAGKAPLAWQIEDFKAWGADIPECVAEGCTEGEAMEVEDIENWFLDTIRNMRVLAEEYPEKYKEQHSLYLLDLEYLKSLGKITKEQKEQMSAKENFYFGQ